MAIPLLDRRSRILIAPALLLAAACAVACNALIGLSGDTEIVARPSDASVDAEDGGVEADGSPDASATGEVRILAGDVGGSGFRDGPSKDARFGRLRGAARDLQGNIYVLDAANAVVRKIDATSLAVSTLAGRPGERGGEDGQLSAARFDQLQGITFDGDHSLWISDVSKDYVTRCTIRQIDLTTASVSTVAGGPCGTQDATGSLARFSPTLAGLAFYNGVLYANDGARIRKLVPTTRAVSTFCGGAITPPQSGTCGVNAVLPYLGDVVLDATTARLYLQGNQPQTFATVDLGSGTFSLLPSLTDPELDGGGAEVFGGLELQSVGAAATIMVGQRSRVRTFTQANATLSTIAGSSAPGWRDGTPMPDARFEGIGGLLATDRAGGSFAVADAFTVRTLTQLRVDTIAGRGTANDFSDGPGNVARIALATYLTFDPAARTIYLYDAGNELIRAFDLGANTMRTIAGKRGLRDVTDADSGADSRFSDEPDGIVYDGKGHLYTSDSGTVSIRRVDVATGATITITKSISLGSSLTMNGAGDAIYFARGSSVQAWDPTKPDETKPVAGVEGARGTSDGAALSARFLTASGLCLDRSLGVLVVSDVEAGTIRKLDLAKGEVSTVAGVAGQLDHVDGVGNAARFRGPKNVGCAGNGEVFVTDTEASTLRRLDLATGAVTTVAGSPRQSVLAPGPLPSTLNRPVQPIVLSPREIVVASEVEAALALVVLPQK